MAVACVWDVKAAKEVNGELLSQLTYQDFFRIQADWKAVKLAAHIPLPADDESSGWDWSEKFAARTPQDRFYAMMVASRIQGLMQIKLNWRAKHLQGYMRSPVVYVEHLETAPWNLVRYVAKSDRLYTQIGTAFIVAVGSISTSTGLDGRIGLHSLPLSEGFYFDLQRDGKKVFQSFGEGYLPYPSLKYFETPH